MHVPDRTLKIRESLDELTSVNLMDSSCVPLNTVSVSSVASNLKIQIHSKFKIQKLKRFS